MVTDLEEEKLWIQTNCTPLKNSLFVTSYLVANGLSKYTSFSSWLCGRLLGWHMSQPGFDPSFENLTCLATLKSCDTTKQSICGWQYMLPYPCGLELSSEGSNGCHSHNARLFKWIELWVAIKQIYVNKTNVMHKFLKFLCLHGFPHGCVVESWVGEWANQILIPASRILRV